MKTCWLSLRGDRTGDCLRGSKASGLAELSSASLDDVFSGDYARGDLDFCIWDILLTLESSIWYLELRAGIDGCEFEVAASSIELAYGGALNISLMLASYTILLLVRRDWR